jgi:hypothetical protein
MKGDGKGEMNAVKKQCVVHGSRKDLQLESLRKA